MTKRLRTGKIKPVKLSDEDHARLGRLSEEVVARLEEMNLILSRNLGRDFHDKHGLLSFRPRASRGRTKAGRGAVPLRSPFDRCIAEVGTNGCLDYCKKICYVCPHYYNQ